MRHNSYVSVLLYFLEDIIFLDLFVFLVHSKPVQQPVSRKCIHPPEIFICPLPDFESDTFLFLILLLHLRVHLYFPPNYRLILYLMIL